MDNLTDKELQELARQKKNEYQRNWRKKNPEAQKKYQDRYWRKRALEDLREREG